MTGAGFCWGPRETFRLLTRRFENDMPALRRRGGERETSFGVETDACDCVAVEGVYPPIHFRARLGLAATASQSCGRQASAGLWSAMIFSRAFRNKARLATMRGFRLRVLSSDRQASRSQWLRISTPPQWPRMRRMARTGGNPWGSQLLMKNRVWGGPRSALAPRQPRTAIKERACGKLDSIASVEVMAIGRHSRRP